MELSAAKEGGDGVDIDDGKVGVLEHRQDAEVQKQRRQEPSQLLLFHPGLVGLLILRGEGFLPGLQIGALPFLETVHPQGRIPAGHRGDSDKDETSPSGKGIENVTGRQQQHPLEPFGHQVVQRKQDGQKQDKSK